MASKLNAIMKFLSHYKYLIVVIIGTAIVGFLDDNSFVRRVKYEIQINNLKAEIERYNAKHRADSIQLHELKNNPKAIEKIARGRYFMKADDEDIYILKSDETVE
ncbi:MAG: septum formation initiator family protein [Prevotella sp.]|nr:septum formation initiator family protein [Prevotella sp.]